MKRSFRALLLAAGFGTRLHPITLNKPKCLVDIGGEPLLGRWVKELDKAGCSEVMINTHYLADQVNIYLSELRDIKTKITVVHEPRLLGTAGTLIANRDFFKGETGLMIHADNVMEEEISNFLKAHNERKKKCVLTMLTFSTKNPESCGIVEVDNEEVVQAFHEKIERPPGNRANGAIYAFEQAFLDQLELMKPIPTDFSTEVLPKIIGHIQSWHTEKTYLDIGTPEMLKTAQQLLKEEQ